MRKIGPGYNLTSRSAAAAALTPALQKARRVGQHQRVVDELAETPPLVVPTSAREGQSAGPTGLGPEPTLVQRPGGDAVSQLLHPTFTIAEELYRKLPEESFFSPEVSSRNPVQFEIGAFEVPDGMQLWIMDYEFAVYRQSGVDPGDIIRAAETRFSGQMGWDIVLNGRRLAHLRYELDPSPISLARKAFASGPSFSPSDPAAFNLAAANSFASTASPGLSLLPVRSNVQGARFVPFTLIAEENTRVALNCVIFKTLRAPIAAVEGRWGGFLVQDQTSQAIINRVRPR